MLGGSQEASSRKGFGKWIICWLAGNEDPIASRWWDKSSPWHAVAMHLLKLALVLNWDGIPIEGDTVAGTIIPWRVDWKAMKLGDHC